MPDLSPEEVIARILIGEAVGEGPEGMEFVRDVGVNRALKSGKSLVEVFTAPKQFSAYARPDLEDFYLKQPEILRNLALEYAREGMREGFVPKHHDITHYTTTDFYENRGSLKPTHWIHSYDPAYTVGRHTALKERKKK